MAFLKDLIVLGVSRFIGDAQGSKFIVDGATSSLFLKGDGTLDSNTYLTEHQSLDDYATKNYVDGKIVDNSTANNEHAVAMSMYASKAEFALKSQLATVATSGSYTDLLNKPTIPDNLLSANYEMSSDSNEDLALEAGDTYEETFGKIEKAINDNEYITSSALNELSNRIDDIPDPVKPDWNATPGSTAEILNKPTNISSFNNDSGYALLNSPTFTGTPTAPTQTSGDSSTQIATTAFVQGEISTQLGNIETLLQLI